MKTIKRIVCSLLLAGACSTFGLRAQENQSYFLHTIEKGQSLYSIASMYGVSQADIIKLNPGSDEKIYIGKTLRIPRNAANTKEETFHTIAAGETLYRLTVKYNVSAKAICDANPGLSADNFRIGQVIRIPQPDTQAAPATSQPVPAASGVPAAVLSRCRDTHKVKRKETVFSISRQYGISEAELIAANPELKGSNKIKKGSLLCIPYPSEAAAKPEATPQDAPTNNELFSKNKKEKESIKTVKAAIILPFLGGSAHSETSRMVEYYEGFLLAVDSLKRTGTSIDLYTYNSGSDAATVNALLKRSELKDMDIIFGPLYQQQIKPLADFADRNDIRLVIPFTSKDNTVFRNPSVYQINTPQSYFYSEVYDHFTRQFPNANVVFIEATQGSKDKAEFIKGLKDELRDRRIAFKSLKSGRCRDLHRGLLELASGQIGHLEVEGAWHDLVGHVDHSHVKALRHQVQNPAILRNGTVIPREGVYDPHSPGTLTRETWLTRLFRQLGWQWGGNWNSLKDYMHFEKP